MKTTLLLHGGMLKYPTEQNTAYYQEIVTGLQDHAQVLIIGFARTDIDDRLATFERDKEQLLSHSSAKITVVNATSENFIEQLENASAIHILGGETPALVSEIKKHPQFSRLIAGKTVGGTSAGACLFAQWFYYNADKSVEAGLGLLPIRIRVHANNPAYGDLDTTLKLLEEHNPELELVKLNECEWIQRTIEI